MPKPAHSFPSARLIAPCPSCHRRVFLDGATHDVHLDPRAGLTSTRPLICPHDGCGALFMLHHSRLHPAPKGTTAFSPRGPDAPKRAHTSATTHPRSGLLDLTSLHAKAVGGPAA